MTDSKAPPKIQSILAKYADKLLLKTILYSLSEADVREFIDLLSAKQYDLAEKLVAEKIPDLEEKVKKAGRQKLKKIFKKTSSE